jgi:hypothetical protein
MASTSSKHTKHRRIGEDDEEEEEEVHTHTSDRSCSLGRDYCPLLPCASFQLGLGVQFCVPRCGAC